MSNAPIIKPTVPAGGITALTGDVTAGPGSGSQVASLASGAVTPAKISTTNTDRINIFLVMEALLFKPFWLREINSDAARILF